MEPSPQSVPPALVAFLLNDCKVDGTVLTRAVLSLAQDGWLEIVPQDQGGGPTLVRVAREPDWDRLSTMDGYAFERVRIILRDLPAAPLSALTTDEGREYEVWSEKFGRAVLAAAKAQGLISHWPVRYLADLLNLLVTVAAGGAVAIVAKVRHWPGNPLLLAVVALFAVGLVNRRIFGPFVKVHQTARGRAVGGGTARGARHRAASGWVRLVLARRGLAAGPTRRGASRCTTPATTRRPWALSSWSTTIRSGTSSAGSRAWTARRSRPETRSVH